MLEATHHALNASPVAAGMLVVVVGPSGAGKDSLINYVRARLGADPTVLFVRRAVTRASDGATEDHESLSPAAFETAVAESRFAVTWEAHGLRYGLPASAYTHVQAGGIAIANGSRQALPSIRESFPRVTVVHVTARPDVIARRLALRGREDVAAIAARLQRTPPEWAGAVEIDNSDDLSVAGEALLSIVQGLKSR